MNYQKHEFNFFPTNEEDYKALKDNIKSNGYDDRFPIYLFEGKILDGYHRYRACSELGLTPKHEALSGTRAEALDFSIRANKDRRHLNSGQWACIAIEIESLFEGVEKEVEEERRRKQAEKIAELKDEDTGKFKAVCVKNLTQTVTDNPVENRNESRAASKIANIFNTNRGYIHQSKTLKEESPERFEKVKTGEIKLNKAFTEMKQEKLQEKKEEIRRIEAESIKTDYTPKYYIEDYKEFLDSFDDNSVDTLITDPPFSTDIDDIKLFAESWLPLALNKVKKSGRGYVFIGAYPVEIKAYLDIFLSQSKFIIDSPLIWTYKNTLGNTPKMKYNLNYQMILHFYADESHELDKSITNEMFSVMEFNAPDGRRFDRLHKWQKPDRLALNLLRHSTAKNDIVVDCFSGSGTFLAAAAKLEMFSYGCDIDIDASKIAERRGACIINGQQI